MISYEEAYRNVLASAKSFGVIMVSLSRAHGRVLADDIFADRDFPPYDRATKDGIAIQLKQDAIGPQSYRIEGMAAAGSPQSALGDIETCHEIMTGAIMPKKANAVVMYEHLEISDGIAKVMHPVSIGQNIHLKGSDEPKGSKVLKKGITLSAAEVGVLASVGKSEVLVQKKPTITIFSTGDELVSVDSTPGPHQIRQSNAHTLRAALLECGIASEIVHVTDNKEAIQTALKDALVKSDVLLMSGGVSKGKFDFIPEALEALGVQKEFHRVAQRPGKPFWFGLHDALKTTVFGFPGNPTSTFVNFNVYFIPWIKSCWGLAMDPIAITITEPFENTIPLTRFERAWAFLEHGKLKAKLVHGNGSGDLTSLVHANGFVQIPPMAKIAADEKVIFMTTRKIV